MSFSLAESRIPVFENAILETMHRMAVLLGQEFLNLIFCLPEAPAGDGRSYALWLGTRETRLAGALQGLSATRGNLGGLETQQCLLTNHCLSHEKNT